ncbi:MAG: DUF4091 domain-containing protein [Firmicutes bacterium]|nr:DUF4091 domain-containing protein [Bacillota bacterium]
MDVSVKTISSLEKVRSRSQEMQTIANHKILLGGEQFSYQQMLLTDERTILKVSVESPLAEYVQLYVVNDAVMDMPSHATCEDLDYLTGTPGIMPDILLPLEEQKGCILFNNYAVVWVEVKIPREYPAGKYPITICYDGEQNLQETMMVEVLPLSLPEQELKFTQWFHVDCIASAHHVPVYSEEHWALIDKYMQLAGELGMNMILTPIFTPPLDTQPGFYRPNTQLVRVGKKEGGYEFDFSMLKRWLDLARKNGMRYFEMSHLFSQWGLKYCPNIYAGEEHLFGWHTPATSPEYKAFLEQLIPQLLEFLEGEGVKENCFFHLSDEPSFEHLDNYRYAYSVVRPLIGDMKIMDALSNVDFYDEGLLDVPVTASNHIVPFLEKQIENQWVYYCTGQHTDVSNRFMAMSSARTRIMGLQMYKYNIKGFLQWGYNFYYSALALYPINPYVTSSAERIFPSGDPFTVYPWKDGVVPSLRGKVFKEGLQDIQLCRLLERYMSHEEVVAWLEERAGMELTFFDYPKNPEYLLKLNDAIKEELKGRV